MHHKDHNWIRSFFWCTSKNWKVPIASEHRLGTGRSERPRVLGAGDNPVVLVRFGMFRGVAVFMTELSGSEYTGQ